MTKFDYMKKFEECVAIDAMYKLLDECESHHVEEQEKCLLRLADLFHILYLSDKKLHNCDTCKHFKDKEWGMCCTVENDDYGLTQSYVSLIKRVGCMSYAVCEE